MANFSEEADLDGAKQTVEIAASIVESAIQKLRGAIAEGESIDDHQVLAYDVAHSAAAVATARHALTTGTISLEDGLLACAFIADATSEIASKTIGRETLWGVKPNWQSAVQDFLTKYRSPHFLASLHDVTPQSHLDQEFELVAETFRKFGQEKIKPQAEHVHRTNSDVPEDVILGLAELGAFGLSVPEEYGGFATGGEHDYVGMVIATEELSRASLGIGGSLITRPEILARALVAGGTEDQKKDLLPKLATAEIMAAVAVTEPNFGSDVAGLSVTATPGDGGWYINGVKTWCTFAARADVLMLLARTNTDKGAGHRGLSLFVVPKPRGDAHGFLFTQNPSGNENFESPLSRPGSGNIGKLEGRPIDTIGYRGMHSYEVAFDNWWVDDSALVGGENGLGKGFYLQMQGFENGRLQTAARAVGVMQAALEAASDYAQNRVVFGSPIGDYQLTRAKIGRMKVILHATRLFAYEVARLMGKGEGAMEASMVKAYVCRAAEWVTREAMQIHGGMGYAEEFPVSRYFVDARVLSIFEGADETLALKVIARSLVAGPKNK